MNHCFLLGAGFSRVITENANYKSLLTDEIMPKISDLIVPELSEDFENTYPNIELFITLLDLKIKWLKNVSLKKKLENIREEIAKRVISFFDIDKFIEDYPLCKKFVEKIPKGARILTLNYDCILDKYLYLSDRWSPTVGYVIHSFPDSPTEDDYKDNILLLKLHGSCNFRVKKTYDENGEINEKREETFLLEITEKIFPGIRKCINDRESNLDKGAYVILMNYLKEFNIKIMQIWREAIEALKNADRLTIIGCSLRDEDTALKSLIHYFGMKDSTEKFAIEIVDKNRENCEKIQSKVETIVARPTKQNLEFFEGL